MNQFVLDLRILMSMTNICWAVLGTGPSLRNLKAALYKHRKRLRIDNYDIIQHIVLC